MLLFHGIFGSGANWRGFARRLVAARPHWGAVLVDLRMHGASQALPPPHNVEAAAGDVQRLAAALGIPVAGVLGHSFGGKVALEMIRTRPDGLEQAWILDSPPGARAGGARAGIAGRVLAILEGLPPRFSSKRQFVSRLEQEGLTRALAQWLAMNLDASGDGYALRFDLVAIRALLDDFAARDLWSVVEAPPPGMELHLVIGGRSDVFSEAERARADRTARAHPGQVFVHVLERAGHWVHTDDPEGLLALLLGRL